MAIKLIKHEYCPHNDEYMKEYLCDTDADFQNLPKCGTGSTAVSIASGTIKIANTAGEWVTFGG